jgi:hemin uptake protein HemP
MNLGEAPGPGKARAADAVVADTRAAPATNPAIKASSLLGSHSSVIIEHNGQLYRLQTTRAGKLILTK